MLGFIIIISAAAVGAVLAIAAISPDLSFIKKAGGVILTLTLLVSMASLLGQQVILMLCTAAITLLVAGFIIQKIELRKAIVGGIAISFVVVAYFWLPYYMGYSLQFGRPFAGFRLIADLGSGKPAFLIALGIAALVACRYMDPKYKAPAVFGGVLLIVLAISQLLEGYGSLFRSFFYGQDPVFKFAVFALVVIGIAGIVRLLSNLKTRHWP